MVRLALPAFLFFALCATAVPQTFNFTISPTVQCGDMTVTWNGGRPPYELVLVPWIEQPGASVQRKPIPRETEAAGNYTFPLTNWRGWQRYIATMSDSTGFGSGGVTDVLTIGKGTTDCEGLDDPPTDGRLLIGARTGSVYECDVLRFVFPDYVPYPAQLVGVIPNGDAFVIETFNNNVYRYNWTCNVRAGSEVVFTMLTDGPERFTDFRQPFRVVAGGDSSCMGTSYGAIWPSDHNNATAGGSGGWKSSSVGSSSASSTSSSTASGGSTADAGSSSSATSTIAFVENGGANDLGKGARAAGSNTSAIIGAVVGTIIGVAVVLGALLWWLLRRRRAAGAEYAIDLHNEADEPDPGMATAVLTPLMPFRDDSAQSTNSADEDSRSRPHHSIASISSPGYTSAQLNNSAHESAATGNEKPGDRQAGRYAAEVDTGVSRSQSITTLPPSYTHVLHASRPTSARPAGPRAPRSHHSAESMNTVNTEKFSGAESPVQ